MTIATSAIDDHLVIYRNSPAPGTLLELSRNWQGTREITCDTIYIMSQTNLAKGAVHIHVNIKLIRDMTLYMLVIE